MKKEQGKNGQRKGQKPYEQMPALQRYIKHTFKEGDFYKKVNHDIILNGSLSIGDKAVYMAILKSCDTKTFRKLPIKEIIKSCGMSEAPVVKSIKVLVDNHFIQSKKTRYESKYKLSEGGKYLKISMKQFEGLKKDYRTYIKRLMAIILSSYNDAIPSYKACSKRTGKISMRLYRELKNKFYKEELYEDDDYDWNYFKINFDAGNYDHLYTDEAKDEMDEDELFEDGAWYTGAENSILEDDKETYNPTRDMILSADVINYLALEEYQSYNSPVINHLAMKGKQSCNTSPCPLIEELQLILDR
ncbi:hypothetical protein SAMN04487911_10938 [Arenibacter nanhaiticus]|uniref:Helix-turn-helix domain-containing protein n=1 Tax=Arenibacter nanhaiticus TaxID=558155 RepID=A0A1M6FPG2_9FLAO|nr:hypothetical protein [Arenibacter nanhaiticus]SHI99648.1 hypothetical protein SAMN04487911_10938 [Arenibacter nanhaiticus]